MSQASEDADLVEEEEDSGPAGPMLVAKLAVRPAVCWNPCRHMYIKLTHLIECLQEYGLSAADVKKLQEAGL